MDKFWKWMEEKGYGFKGMCVQILDFGGPGIHVRHVSNIDTMEIPKQMLIGYMAEYLLSFPEDENRTAPEPIYYSSIDDMYDNYVEAIIKKNKETT
jgi:hypothetical protein